MTVHVGIIDKDPVRLVTPLLDSRNDCDHMIFIGDESQREQFLKLKEVLDFREISCEFFIIPNVVNTLVLKEQVKALAERLKKEFKTVNFNASCGVRHRLLSVYEIFRSYDYGIFVVEAFSDRQCWLYPENTPDVQVQDHIRIGDYLRVFGARCEFPYEELPMPLYEKLQELGTRWAQNALELGPGLATLNYLATCCRKEQKLDVELSDKQQTYRELNMLITDLVHIGLATYEQGILTFYNEDARRFSNGEWLENLVHGTVREIQDEVPTVQDHSLNVQVYRMNNGQEVRNELDVATVVNNKLHIIECKTKGMRDDGDDTLYKLESLRDLLGGLQARAMLVSFRPMRHEDITRARDLNLALIGPLELKNLKQNLTNWFNEAGE